MPPRTGDDEDTRAVAMARVVLLFGQELAQLRAVLERGVDAVEHLGRVNDAAVRASPYLDVVKHLADLLLKDQPPWWRAAIIALPLLPFAAATPRTLELILEILRQVQSMSTP